jgi:uncharacterized membrane protein
VVCVSLFLVCVRPLKLGLMLGLSSSHIKVSQKSLYVRCNLNACIILWLCSLRSYSKPCKLIGSAVSGLGLPCLFVSLCVKPLKLGLMLGSPLPILSVSRKSLYVRCNLHACIILWLCSMRSQSKPCKLIGSAVSGLGLSCLFASLSLCVWFN